MKNLPEGQYFGRSSGAIENDLFKFSVTNYESHESIGFHDHENSYLSILINGCYKEGAKEDATIVLPGHVLFRPSSYSHSNQFDNQEATCFNVEFKKGWKCQVEEKVRLPKKFVQYSIGSFPSLYKALVAFKSNQEIDFISEHIYDWLYELGNKCLPDNRSCHIEKAIEILDNELDTFHSLSSLADRVCVHPVYLSRSFKKAIGYTISEYQLMAKLACSLSLLMDSTKSISTIAYRNGFFDDSHFIRSFRARYGISPLQYRKTLNG